MKFDRMLASLNAFILEEVLGATGLDRIHQFLVHIQSTKGGDEVFPGQAEGILHGSVGRSKDDETIGRTSLPYLPVAEGITESSPLKINMGDDHPLQAILPLLLHRRPGTLCPC